MVFIHGVDTVETVLKIRKSILTGMFVEDNGLVMVSWNSGGTTVTKQFAMSIEKLLMQIKQFLQEEDPDLYGNAVRRMSPSYF